jgi:hypothetical protein
MQGSFANVSGCLCVSTPIVSLMAIARDEFPRSSLMVGESTSAR